MSASVAACCAAHPRSRGENSVAALSSAKFVGSSPLTRGKPKRTRASRLKPGLIPAHAGKTEKPRRLPRMRVAHPRSRGENYTENCRLRLMMGSSPLTRGKQVAGSSPVGGTRLIPAHAGKTRTRTLSISPSRAHPRSRGENGLHPYSMSSSQGSSPLTRGKHESTQLTKVRLRLIPAHAGKTVFHVARAERRRAHPRSRGENGM